ncbi:Lrp/AsnC family transcriptional regulator [Jiangella ureilytica]|uniref:Lrp/AsnC family transcriptional regulator n=1 Tax=Jiangella ureilytica TaxID=2530374 RepID=A0A4R4RM61_9ACTN|nr:Lrp/AsnC family transcriptional regulator [Jiangella ureilytica]TDC50831.1 Lrp/AsnC family transcriptional regulator [Jiangella ureilytica]
MIDGLDARILELFTREPRIGVLEASRRLQVARGTVQARLDRLRDTGVIASLAPTVDPAALGFRVTAFASLDIRQGARASVAAHLSRIPEVLEVHTITGQGDLLCRIVARDNDDLQRVIDDLVGDDDIVRTSTLIALSTVVAPRILPLVESAATPPSRSWSTRGITPGESDRNSAVVP